MNFIEGIFHASRSLAGAGLGLLFVAVASLSPTRATAESFYPLGFAWERNLDWQVRDATDAGSTVGNPVPDTLGNDVWHYSSIEGGSTLSSANPWYLLPSVPMVWEPSSLGTGIDGSWIRKAPELSPSSSRFSLFHETHTSQYTPEVSWRNPTGRNLSLRITGSVKVQWDSAHLTQTPVDLAIAQRNGTSVTETLLTGTIPMPAPVGTTVSVQIPVDLFVDVGISESIRITARMQSGEEETRVSVQDCLTISIVGADLDRDGLSNTSEQRIGTNPLDFDSDNDGWSDTCEDEFGGNPVDQNKAPDFRAYIASNPSDNEPSIRYPAAKSHSYRLEESGDLFHWTAPATGIPGEGQTASIPVPPPSGGSKFFRVKSAPPVSDAIVESYRNATGISEDSAGGISKMLAQLRSAGMDPDFFWVGGSRYNQPDQSRAVIGGSGTIVGAGTTLPYAETEDACRFKRGKYLQFDQPEVLRATEVDDLAIAVWFEELDYTSDSNVVSTDDPAAKGILLQQLASGEMRLFTYPSATAVYPTMTFPVPTWSTKIGKRSQYYRIERLSPGTTIIHGLLDSNSMENVTGAVLNNHTKISIGGNSLTSTSTHQSWLLANCRVTAVAIARKGPTPKTILTYPGGPSITVADEAHKITEAPYLAGILARQDFPSVLTLGDSTTTTKWNTYSFGTAPLAGAWTNNAVAEDYSAGGTSMDFHVAVTPYVEQLLTSAAYGPKYLIYTPEGLLDQAAGDLGLPEDDPTAWYEYAEAWLEGIQQRTKCIMALASYIKGNTSDPESGRSNRDIVRNMALAHDWYYIPMWENPHSQVWTGSVPGSYGFYGDMIHQTEPGMQVEAEIFASAVPHLTDTASPRADLNNPPRVSGLNSVGNSLSCSAGKWFHFPSDFSYQWLRNLAAIPGATSADYLVQPADQGARLACRVVANKPGYKAASFTSAPTAQIQP